MTVLLFLGGCRFLEAPEVVPHREHVRWAWGSIDTSQVSFPRNFVFGVSTAAYQDGGSHAYPRAQLAWWERAASLQPSGMACDGWRLAVQDIGLLKELGVGAYRMSVDWSCIEPEEGTINLDALDYYRELLTELRRAGIRVMVTLHHFVHPLWFEARGAFEREENIALFVRFCKIVYTELGDLVDWWCTINEPSVYMLQGYLRGVLPPGKSVPFFADTQASNRACKFRNLALGARVLKHMLQAHVHVYRALHELHGKYCMHSEQELQVGLAHSYLVFENFHDTKAPVRRYLESSMAQVLTGLMNDSVLHFFHTGEFAIDLAGARRERIHEPDAPHSLDFIGINYYSHVFLRFQFQLKEMFHPGYYPEDIRTDMPYAVYAEGLYRAIEHVASLGLPIYITENGISDAADTKREVWIQRYLYALSRALSHGYDVRGYFYWTLLDNWEWERGYGQRFGLYAVDRVTQKRTLKGGAKYYARVAHTHAQSTMHTQAPPSHVSCLF